MRRFYQTYTDDYETMHIINGLDSLQMLNGMWEALGQALSNASLTTLALKCVLEYDSLEVQWIKYLEIAL